MARTVKPNEYGVITSCPKDVKEAVIPAGVTAIGVGAFEGCSSLASVVIPESVTAIGYKAFEDCTSLSSVVIPEGVKKIGGYAFFRCKSLKSISLPSTLEEIGKDVFKGCDAVEIITSASPLFPFNEKTRKLYDATGKTKKVILVANAAKEEAKQEKIKEVQLASAGAVLDSIVQAHPVTNVHVRKKEKECFIVIPAKDGGMELCLANSKVQKWMQTLPVLLDKAANNATAAELREYAKANDLPDASRKYITVSKDGSVKKKNAEPVYLVIPEGVTEINRWAFSGCTSLSSVVIPESVTEIGERAFSGCAALASVVIPDSVTRIDSRAFKDCTSLASVVIGAGVTKIGRWAFSGCAALASVVIPDSVTEIGEWAFDGCNITELSHPCLTIKGGVAIKDGKVQYCASQAREIVIPEGVTEIGEYAFNGCAALASVVIPESVTEIGEETFNGCAALASVVIPESVTRIGGYAFEGCTALASVGIPSSVTEIGYGAFSGCESLASVEFGGTVAQWKAVEKSRDWHEDVPAKSVKCADGRARLFRTKRKQTAESGLV
ncbi:leucine-rich repeat domain-containing protein [Treponema saccharophilum]|uniref:Surface antigen BspA n=1 Tax=Treponema saccharophilum DSM 2985 TaxID=907348 RepID=H7EGX0_9SPIR|nr:leucine-rich repeat domain-containing protein [Treponema saccharophilum]EIC03171.1 surface antigen BspA [Treponema saccharophilum DSM 2985]BDC96077.1 hypothetical protein TRSA_11760 [Treponema saccharophilum]